MQPHRSGEYTHNPSADPPAAVKAKASAVGISDRGVLADRLGGGSPCCDGCLPVFRLHSALRTFGATHQRDALVLAHLYLADSIGAATARWLFPLVEREDLIQVAREVLLHVAAGCRSGKSQAPYLRRCITGALQYHLRDRVSLVRLSPREPEK